MTARRRRGAHVIVLHDLGCRRRSCDPSRSPTDQAALAFDPLLFVSEELPEPELLESVDDFLASSLFEAPLSLASVFVVDFESPAVDVDSVDEVFLEP